ncbi:MAG: biotin--[acetyl-CoA-carboxylase] ligase [Marinilabiliaceae bacterium]
MEPPPEIIQPEETESTSSYLKEILKQRQLPECSVVITNRQTAGRGQPGNAWISNPGKNLTFSMIFYPEMVPASEQFILSKAVTVAITDVLGEMIPEVSIKWPNDIYHQDRKLGGILIENTLNGPNISQSIAGIGLNINQMTFSETIPNPVSLQKITGQKHELLPLFESIFHSLTEHYAQLVNDETETISEKYMDRFYRKKGWHKYKDANGEFTAKFSRIGPAGHLFLQRKNGEISRYAFKEVEFII